MVKTSSKPLSEEELKRETDIVSIEEKDGLNSVNVTPDDTNYDSETYVGLPAEKEEESTGDEPKKDKDGKSYIQQRKSYNMSNVDKNKLMNTHIGDHINYFDNGRQDNGIVTKMDSSFITIVKENGHVSQVHINDTFFVSDILVNKTWNDMDMEERTVQLQEIHAYSPRYLSKTWEQLPRELKDVLKVLPKKFNDNQSKWKAPYKFPLDQGDHTDADGLARGSNTDLGTSNEIPHGDSIVQGTSSHGDIQSDVGRKIRERGHGRNSGMQGTLSRRNANIMQSNSKPERNNAAYKQNQALGQSIQGNVEKEGEGMSTSSEGAFNATFGKDNLTVNPKKVKKGAPADVGNSWGIKYINKKDEEKV